MHCLRWVVAVGICFNFLSGLVNGLKRQNRTNRVGEFDVVDQSCETIRTKELYVNKRNVSMRARTLHSFPKSQQPPVHS